MSKCKYVRDSEIEQYETSCTGDWVHPIDVLEWAYCPFCGDKIKLVEDY